MESVDTPVRPTRVIVQDSGDPGYTNRLMVGTACTGLLRVEWVAARYGQLVPLNWSMAAQMQLLQTPDYMPLRYLVSDAQNLIVAEAMRLDMEWLFLLEHDVVIPPDTFMRLNRYMREARCPVVSGLYFSRAYPSEPMVFRGLGAGSFVDWRMGDLVWCDGVPTGCLLIHCSILRAMWADAEEYQTGGTTTRRVFDTPRKGWFDESTGQFNTTSGTSDLDWCTRVITGGYLYKAGWGAFAEEHPRWPFLVDTRIFSKHINPDGTQFPLEVSAWQS